MQVRRLLTTSVACFAFLSLILSACTQSNAAIEETPEPLELETGLYSGPQVEAEPNPFGVKWRWDLIDDIEEDVIAVAGGTSPAELQWCEVEPEPGARDYDRIDEIIASTARIGYTPVLRIRVGTCWATGNPEHKAAADKALPSRMPLDLGAYAAFVGEVVHRYAPQGVLAYAIESEVNLESFWRGSAAEYDQLLRTAANSVRQASPDSRVLDSGLSSTTYGIVVASSMLQNGQTDAAVEFYNDFYERWFALDDFELKPVTSVGELQAQLATGRAVRSLAFYEATIAAADAIDAFQLRYFENWDFMKTVVGTLRVRLPMGRPIEAWAIGIAWPGDDFDEEEARIEVAKLLSVGSGLGISLLVYQPGANPPEMLEAEEVIFRSLWRAPGNTRPAGQAFEVMVEAAAGERVATTPVTGIGLEGVAYGHTKHTNLVIWATEAPIHLDGELPKGSSIHDLDGEEVEWPVTGLIVTSDPIVVEIPKTLSSAVKTLLDRETIR